jgi:hypothetical protein
VATWPERLAIDAVSFVTQAGRSRRTPDLLVAIGYDPPSDPSEWIPANDGCVAVSASRHVSPLARRATSCWAVGVRYWQAAGVVVQRGARQEVADCLVGSLGSRVGGRRTPRRRDEQRD